MPHLIYPPLILNIQLLDLEFGNLLFQSAEPRMKVTTWNELNQTIKRLKTVNTALKGLLSLIKSKEGHYPELQPYPLNLRQIMDEGVCRIYRDKTSPRWSLMFNTWYCKRNFK